jgi:hypothetical protein
LKEGASTPGFFASADSKGVRNRTRGKERREGSVSLKKRHCEDEERDARLKPGLYKGKDGGLKTRRYEGGEESRTLTGE